MDVLRYMVDQTCKRALRIDADPEYELLKDSFDVLISDGEFRCMVAMHPSLRWAPELCSCCCCV